MSMSSSELSLSPASSVKSFTSFDNILFYSTSRDSPDIIEIEQREGMTSRSQSQSPAINNAVTRLIGEATKWYQQSEVLSESLQSFQNEFLRDLPKNKIPENDLQRYADLFSNLLTETIQEIEKTESTWRKSLPTNRRASSDDKFEWTIALWTKLLDQTNNKHSASNQTSSGSEDADLVSLRNKLSKAEGKVSELSSKLQRTETELNALRNDVMNPKSSGATSSGGSSSELQYSQMKKMIDSLMFEQNSLSQIKRELEEKVDSLLEEKVAMKRETMALRGDLELGQVKIQSLERDVQQRQQQLDQEKRRHEQYESSKSSFDSKMSILAQTENRYKAEIQRLEEDTAERCRKYESEISTLKSQLISARRAAENAEAEQAAVEEERTSLQAELRRSKTLLDASMKEQMETAQVKGELEFKLSAAETKIIELTAEIKMNREEMEKMRRKLDTIDVEHSQRQQEYEQNKRAWVATKNGLDTQITILTESESKLRIELRRIEQFNVELQDKVIMYESDLAKCNRELANLRKSQSEAIDELEHGEEIKMLYEKIAHLEEQIREEQDNTSLVAGELEGHIQSLMQEKGTLQRELNSLRDRDSKLQELEKDFSQKSSQVEQLKRQLESASEQISKLTEVEVRLNSQCNQQKVTISDQLERIHIFEEDMRKLRTELSELRKREAEMRDNDTSDQRIQTLNIEITRLENVIASQQNEFTLRNSEWEGKVTALQRDKFTLQEKITTLSSELAQSQGQVLALGELSSGNTSQRDWESKQWEMTKNALDAEVAKLSETETRLRAELRRTEQISLEMTSKCDILESDISSRNKQITRLKDEIVSLTNNTKELENRMMELNNKNMTTQKVILSILSEVEGIKGKVEALRLLTSSSSSSTSSATSSTHRVQTTSESNSDSESEYDVLKSTSTNTKTKRDFKNESVDSYTSELASNIKQLDMEVDGYRDVLANAQKSERQSLESILVTKDNEIAAISTDIKVLKAKLKQEKIKTAELTTELEASNDKVQKDSAVSQKAIVSLRAETEVWRGKAEALEHELSLKGQQLVQQKERMETVRSESEAQIAMHMESESRLRVDLKRQEMAATELVERIKGYEEDIAKLRQDLTLLRRSEGEARALLENTDNITTLENEIARLQSQIRTEQIKTAQVTTEFEEQVQRLTDKIAAMQQDRLTGKADVAKLQSQIESLEQDLSVKSHHLELQRRQWENMKGELEAEISKLTNDEVKAREGLRRSEKTISELMVKCESLESELESQKNHSLKLNEESRLEMRRSYETVVTEMRCRLESTEVELTNRMYEISRLQEELSEHRAMSVRTEEWEFYRNRAEALEDELLQLQDEYGQQRRLLESSRKTLENQSLLSMESETHLRNELRKAEQNLEIVSQQHRELQANMRTNQLEIWKEQESNKMFQQQNMEEEMTLLKHQIEHLRDEAYRCLKEREDVVGQMQSLQMRCDNAQIELNILKTELEVRQSMTYSNERDVSKKNHFVESYNRNTNDGTIEKGRGKQQQQQQHYHDVHYSSSGGMNNENENRRDSTEKGHLQNNNNNSSGGGGGLYNSSSTISSSLAPFSAMKPQSSSSQSNGSKTGQEYQLYFVAVIFRPLEGFRLSARFIAAERFVLEKQDLVWSGL
eukprot:gene554-1064_t